MDTLETIFSRRSIRRYIGKPIGEDVVKELLEAAMYAPTAYNQQPWKFVVVRDRAVLDQVPNYHPSSSPIKLASLAILVCGDRKLFKSLSFWPHDCAAATQNILLAGTAHGLGTVWIGVYPEEQLIDGMRTLFSIPGHIIPFSLIAIGYPAEDIPKPDRFDDQRIHYDHW